MDLDPRDSLRDQLVAWRWLALLLFALVTPIGLPSAQSERRQPELRRRLPQDPLLTSADLSLHTAPDCEAPVLCQVSAGESLRIVRGWTGQDGKMWIQAKLSMAVGGASRGWIPLDFHAGA